MQATFAPPWRVPTSCIASASRMRRRHCISKTSRSHTRRCVTFVRGSTFPCRWIGGGGFVADDPSADHPTDPRGRAFRRRKVDAHKGHGRAKNRDSPERLACEADTEEDGDDWRHEGDVRQSRGLEALEEPNIRDERDDGTREGEVEDCPDSLRP